VAAKANQTHAQSKWVVVNNPPRERVKKNLAVEAPFATTIFLLGKCWLTDVRKDVARQDEQRLRPAPVAGLLTGIVLQGGLIDPLENDELDAAVLTPTLFVVLRTDGLGFAVATRLQTAELDASVLEGTHD